MQFVPSCYEDIHRYYRHSYVKFKETGDRVWYIDAVNPNKVEATDHAGDKLVLYLDEAHPYEVDYILPHKTYFQYGDRAAQLIRIPAKQYQRGISESNTAVVVMRDHREYDHYPVSFDTLDKFVNKQKFFTITEAVRDTNMHSMVLSPRMMYMKGMIFVDTTLVATLGGDKKSIIMKKEIFREEVAELLKGSEFFLRPVAAVSNQKTKAKEVAL